MSGLAIIFELPTKQNGVIDLSEAISNLFALFNLDFIVLTIYCEIFPRIYIYI